jgi:hypothetical protein
MFPLIFNSNMLKFNDSSSAFGSPEMFQFVLSTVGHSRNAAVIEKCIMTIGLVLWVLLLNVKTAWARLCKTSPPMVPF